MQTNVANEKMTLVGQFGATAAPISAVMLPTKQLIAMIGNFDSPCAGAKLTTRLHQNNPSEENVRISSDILVTALRQRG